MRRLGNKLHRPTYGYGCYCQKLAHDIPPYRSLFFTVIQMDANSKKNLKRAEENVVQPKRQNAFTAVKNSC